MNMPLCMKMLCFPVMLLESIIPHYSASFKCFPIWWEQCIFHSNWLHAESRQQPQRKLFACLCGQPRNQDMPFLTLYVQRQTNRPRLCCQVPIVIAPMFKERQHPPPLETRKYAVCIRLFLIRRQKHLSSLCFGKYSMFFHRLSRHVGFDIIWSLSCSGGLG